MNKTLLHLCQQYSFYHHLLPFLSSVNPGVSATLQGLDIPIITNPACSTTWEDVDGAAINDGHICGFEQTGGLSACSVCIKHFLAVV